MMAPSGAAITTMARCSERSKGNAEVDQTRGERLESAVECTTEHLAELLAGGCVSLRGMSCVALRTIRSRGGSARA